ncbi:MAG: hypothetical protein P8Z50_07760, partial [candidate division WOR-3 bacterium]
MRKEKIVLMFISIILPFTCFGQQIDESLLQQIQGGQKTPSAAYQSQLEDTLKKEPPVEKPESLSTIEKMFNEKYMITPRRINLELSRDSLEEQVKAESLKIELRKQYLTSDELQDKYLIPADTTYFHLRKKLSKL